MLNETQFSRIRTALEIPVRERRLASYSARKAAAKKNATDWALRVVHSDHDSLHEGITDRSQSYVRLSREEFPDPLDAEAHAYLMGRARGTYPTRVEHA